MLGILAGESAVPIQNVCRADDRGQSRHGSSMLLIKVDGMRVDGIVCLWSSLDMGHVFPCPFAGIGRFAHGDRSDRLGFRDIGEGDVVEPEFAIARCLGTAALNVHDRG